MSLLNRDRIIERIVPEWWRRNTRTNGDGSLQYKWDDLRCEVESIQGLPAESCSLAYDECLGVIAADELRRFAEQFCTEIQRQDDEAMRKLRGR